MCCKNQGHQSCGCQREKSHGCGHKGHFSRRFFSNQEKITQLESYLVYPEEMKSVARVQVFRDFLIQKAQRWTY